MKGTKKKKTITNQIGSVVVEILDPTEQRDIFFFVLTPHVINKLNMCHFFISCQKLIKPETKQG